MAQTSLNAMIRSGLSLIRKTVGIELRLELDGGAQWSLDSVEPRLDGCCKLDELEKKNYQV